MARGDFLSGRPWLRRAYLFACALVATLVVTAIQHDGPKTLVEHAVTAAIATVTIVMTMVLVELLGAAWRRAASQSEETNK